MTFYNTVYIRLTTAQDIVGDDIVGRFLANISMSQELNFKVLGSIQEINNEENTKIKLIFPKVNIFDKPYPAFNPNDKLLEKMTRIISEYWDYLHKNYGKKLQYSVVYQCRKNTKDHKICINEIRRS